MRVIGIALTAVLSVTAIVGAFAVLARRLLVTDELTTLLPMLRRLPRRLERIASAVEHGRRSAQVRLFADQRDRRHLTGLLHQVLIFRPERP